MSATINAANPQRIIRRKTVYARKSELRGAGNTFRTPKPRIPALQIQKTYISQRTNRIFQQPVRHGLRSAHGQ